MAERHDSYDEQNERVDHNMQNETWRTEAGSEMVHNQAFDEAGALTATKIRDHQSAEKKK